MSKNNFGGVNGFQNNKVGSVVGYQRKGEQVYRGYRKNVANPNTQPQQRARGRFGAMSSFLRLMAVPVAYGYGLAVKGTKYTERNMAMKNCWPALSGSGPIPTIDYSKIKLSKGNLNTPLIGRLDMSTANNVRIPIPSGVYDTYTREHMTLVCVVYCPAIEQIIVERENYANVVTGASANVQVPTAWNGLEVYVWVYLGALNGDIEDQMYGFIPNRSVSDTVFAGSGEIQ